jgi:hypothetical protein
MGLHPEKQPNQHAEHVENEKAFGGPLLAL